MSTDETTARDRATASDQWCSCQDPWTWHPLGDTPYCDTDEERTR